MRIVTTYKEAADMLQELFGPWHNPQPINRGEAQYTKPSLINMNAPVPQIGVDIGKQFGTRVVMHITVEVARKLLSELQKRDLPCPQIIYQNNRILIGADPE